MRRIASLPCQRADTQAVTYSDSEWAELIVYLVINGKKDEPSSYHSLGFTSADKADCLAVMHTFAALPVDKLPVTARIG